MVFVCIGRSTAVVMHLRVTSLIKLNTTDMCNHPCPVLTVCMYVYVDNGLLVAKEDLTKGFPPHS